jgi:hypothetical protein
MVRASETAARPGFRDAVGAQSGSSTERPTRSRFGGGEPQHVAELRRLFTTFGYLVAR